MENLKKYLWEQHKKATISGVLFAIVCFFISIVDKSPDTTRLYDFFMSTVSGCIIFAIVAYPEQAKKIGVKILKVLKVIGLALVVFFKYALVAFGSVLKILFAVICFPFKILGWIGKNLPDANSGGRNSRSRSSNSTNYNAIRQSSYQPQQSSYQPPKKEISYAIQQGSNVNAYDSKNQLLFSRYGELDGYTSSTVSIYTRTNHLVSVYDVNNKFISGRVVYK